MRRLVFSILFAFLLAQMGMAQGIIVRGSIRDAFDHTGLENAKVQILNSDSNIVSIVAAEIPLTGTESDGAVRYTKNVNSGAVFECNVPQGGNYTAVVSMVGYETKRLPFEVPQRYKQKLDIGDIYLFPRQDELDEVTVTATKLKMYHNGDTLIYNADAFVLDKHNVLEDLVKMLPGVELHDGQVFANGRFVESIVISGKDVMPGDPTQLMKMLPAYIVDKLKFYDKQGEKSKTMGKNMLDDSYVMDVCLKRDYHAAWLGNMEVGGGTENRWEGLGFVMRFDDRQYFSVSADANNTGRERESTDLCTVETEHDDKELTNRQLNINYAYYPTDKLRFDVGGIIRRQDSSMGVDEKQRLDISNASDLYKLYRSRSNRKDDYYKGNMSVSIRPRQGIYGKIAYSFAYGKDTNESNSLSTTSLSDIDMNDSVWRQLSLLKPAIPEGITNIYTDSVRSMSQTRQHKAETEWHFALGGNLLKVKADLNLSHNDDDIRQQYTNRLFDDEGSDAKSKNVRDTQLKDVTTSMSLEYDINYIETSARRGILTPYYTFSHKNAEDGRIMTLFEPQEDGAESGRLDTDNSRTIKERLNIHTLGVNWSHEMQLPNKGWLIFNGQLPVQIKDVNVRLLHETAANRNSKQYLLLSPSLEMKWHPKADDRRGNTTSLSFKGWCSQTTPKETYLLSQTDTSDPLNTYLGNPYLKKQTDLGLTLGFRHYFERSKHSTYATLNGNKTWNSIAVRSVYDTQSGLRTYTPVNVDGKYNASLECGYNMPLTSDQTFWLNLSAGSSLTRCANMMYDEDNSQEVGYMRVYGYNAKANLRWNNKSRKVEINYTAAYGGNGISSGNNYNDNMRDLSNNISVTGHLPAGINATVNCNFVTRFGYATESLNKTFVYANAQISKSVCKDKLELCLSAMDIFRQRKKVRFVMNGEGHTETVATRYIPAYVLASVRYNWSYTPKKKL